MVQPILSRAFDAFEALVERNATKWCEYRGSTESPGVDIDEGSGITDGNDDDDCDCG